MSFELALADALADLDVEASQAATLASHWSLVRKWTERSNLTNITNAREAAWLHYRDSLELVALLLPGDLLDIGSGAGFPGVPLAVMGFEVTMMEPRRKRASFLRTSRSRLHLSFNVLEARSTDRPEHQFVNVVTRATFSDDSRLRDCLEWVRPGGQLLAMRAPPCVK